MIIGDRAKFHRYAIEDLPHSFSGFDGALALTTAAVAFDAAVAEPSPLVAVTRTRRRRPTSALATTYLEVLAPPIVAQSDPSEAPPSAPQRTHWYANVIGLAPAQVPAPAVSVCPCCAVPEIVGSAVFLAGPVPVGDAWTVAVGFEAAVVLPELFFAVTRARMR